MLDKHLSCFAKSMFIHTCHTYFHGVVFYRSGAEHYFSLLITAVSAFSPSCSNLWELNILRNASVVIVLIRGLRKELRGNDTKENTVPSKRGTSADSSDIKVNEATVIEARKFVEMTNPKRTTT